MNGRQNRREARRLRNEALRDLHRALYAEIAVNLANLGGLDAIETAKQAQVARMKKSNNHRPFLTHQKRDMVFQAFLRDINILPRSSIDPIVTYYALVNSIEQMEHDIRSDRFMNLNKDGRIALYSDYMDLLNQSVTYGWIALQLIDCYGKNGVEAARTLSSQLWVNNRLGGDPDALSQDPADVQ